MPRASVANYETLLVSRDDETGILHVVLNRPQKLNAMSTLFFKECESVFNKASKDAKTRVCVLYANGKHFTAGLDLVDAGATQNQSMLGGDDSEKSGRKDVGRRAYHMARHVMELQRAFTAIEECPKPVIAVTHGATIGGGIDMVSACDIRFCTSSSYFCVKEVAVGLAADIGTLQRFPRVCGNESVVRELCYTARKFGAGEAHKIGFVSNVLESKEAALAAAMECAKAIAQHSPLAVTGTKVNLNYSREHSVSDGLKHVAVWNGAMLQSEDMMKAAMGFFSKKKVLFSKL